MAITDAITAFVAIIGFSWLIITILAKFFPDDPES